MATRGGFTLSPGVAAPALGPPTSLLARPHRLAAGSLASPPGQGVVDPVREWSPAPPLSLTSPAPSRRWRGSAPSPSRSRLRPPPGHSAPLAQSGWPHVTERSSSGGLRLGAAGAGERRGRPRRVAPRRRECGGRPRRGRQWRSGQVAPGAPGLPRGGRRRRWGQAGAPRAGLSAPRTLSGRSPRATPGHPGRLPAAEGARLRRSLLRGAVRLRCPRHPSSPRPYAAPAPRLTPAPPHSGRDPWPPGTPSGGEDLWTPRQQRQGEWLAGRGWPGREVVGGLRLLRGTKVALPGLGPRCHGSWSTGS